MKVLVIEDEQAISDLIAEGLSSHGYQVTQCLDGNEGYHLAMAAEHQAIVLDINLPNRDGLSILEAIRGTNIDTPVILLTARNELGDRIKGLELGADDYLPKPFYVEELHARISAVMRRYSGTQEHELSAGALTLDCISRQASCHGHSVDLTSREFALLEYLMRSPGQVFTRGQILEKVWGYDFDPCTNVVDVCIKRIRQKIRAIDTKGRSSGAIESVRGTGYRLTPR